jgi:hypothetical protein
MGNGMSAARDAFNQPIDGVWRFDDPSVLPRRAIPLIDSKDSGSGSHSSPFILFIHTPEDREIQVLVAIH